MHDVQTRGLNMVPSVWRPEAEEAGAAIDALLAGGAAGSGGWSPAPWANPYPNHKTVMGGAASRATEMSRAFPQGALLSLPVARFSLAKVIGRVRSMQ